jgi:hypothetical protein
VTLLVATDTGMRAIVIAWHAKKQAQECLQIAYQILFPDGSINTPWNQINYFAIHLGTADRHAEYYEKSDMVFCALPATVLALYFRR